MHDFFLIEADSAPHGNDERAISSITRYFESRFRNDLATEIRIISAVAGLISLFLPWGSIILRDGGFHATIEIIGVSPVGALGSGDLVVALASSALVAFTMLAIIEGLTVIGQAIGAGWFLVCLPSIMSSISTPPELIRQDSLMGFGALIYFLSMAGVLLSLYVKSTRERFPIEETFPNDQRPVVRYDDYSKLGGNVNHRRPPR